MKINVRNFIFQNITAYNGNDSFLTGPSTKTKKLRNKCKELLTQELENNGVLDIDTSTISTVTSHKP